MTPIDMPESFWQVHRDLPQEGPGSTTSTLKALSYIKELPQAPQILDIGCGPGRQTIDLAKATGGSITAIDLHEPYLEQLRARAYHAGAAKHVTTVNASMDALELNASSVDLIWSEGAIYSIGFEKGLRLWKKFLRPGGYMAVTECSWLRDDPPPDLKAFWDKEYPAMQSADANIKIVQASGLIPVAHFTLPESDWWNYYRPIQERAKALMAARPDNPALLRTLRMEQDEMALYKNYSRYYGYVFYIMRSL